jgi:hypothetical protein
MVNYSTNINKTNIHLSPKESINSESFFRWEVIVCLVDFGRIIDQHCLKFL